MRRFYARLAIAEAALWQATRVKVGIAQSRASLIADILHADPHPFSVDYVTRLAAEARTALNGMTTVQRVTLLSQPLVALAHDIAMDCEAEFDNGGALPRWRAKAAQITQEQNR